MKFVKLAAATLNQTPLDWAGNTARILAAIEETRAQNVSVLCLPELCITGYGCEDAFHSLGVHQRAWQILHDVAPHTKGMIVSLGLPVFFQNAVFNCAAMLVDGAIAGFVAKRFLAGDGIHYEPRWFKPWPAETIETLHAEGHTYPIGDIHFSCGPSHTSDSSHNGGQDAIKIGFEICEDAWVAGRPGRSLSLRGIDLILNPSASHFAFGKLETRKRFVLEGSRAFGVTYLYANLLGNESGRAIYDGGAFIAAGGSLVAAGPRLNFADHSLTIATVDISLSRISQLRTASFMPQIKADPSCIYVPFAWPVAAPETNASNVPLWEKSETLKEEEFVRAEAIALFDYLRKSKSKGFVVSLSGGVDSAAVSTLVATMIELALQDLGRDALLKKLAHIPELASAKTPEEFTKLLLTCAYQATENSSQTTRDAARSVAASLNATYYEFDIDPLVKQYSRIVETALGRPLTWQTDDIALQNIQARVRSPGIWMLANLNNALLLATSNRSEAAVGYATMDGDTSGGLSPIAGIDKNFLRKWCRWMETMGPVGVGPIPALAAVNKLAPTAELRPSAASQTDEDDLMPYDVLDAIERAAIRDKRTPTEVLTLMQSSFPQHSVPNLKLWITRFFRLWSRNQWKRERYAPSFHLDDENLDPKTWCRYPILSGGFEQELKELQ